MPSCCSWISLVRPGSLLPTRVLSLGWLKSVISLTSTLNSPVNHLVSIGDSWVRLLPLSPVKSAKAYGSGAFGPDGWFFPAAATGVDGSGWPMTGADPGWPSAGEGATCARRCANTDWSGGGAITASIDWGGDWRT